MSWFIISALILIGWFLLFAEIFFIPGISILAIIGWLLMFAGVTFSFQNYGANAGWITVGVAVLFNIITFITAFKRGVWKKFSLMDTLDGKTNTFDENKIAVGVAGRTISKVAPIGKAMFSEENFEVQSFNGDYIEENKSIEVVNISNNKIFVKIKN